jgi:DNA helicase-2/ATP-dependent DNA helicase PcrA
VIRLEQNYRSHGNILDAANAIIKNNPRAWARTCGPRPAAASRSASMRPWRGDEARWIVEEVKALQREGLARAEIALLYRSNAQSRVLEHALFSAGLPYRVYGGLRFFERRKSSTRWPTCA